MLAPVKFHLHLPSRNDITLSPYCLLQLSLYWFFFISPSFKCGLSPRKTTKSRLYSIYTHPSCNIQSLSTGYYYKDLDSSLQLAPPSYLQTHIKCLFDISTWNSDSKLTMPKIELLILSTCHTTYSSVFLITGKGKSVFLIISATILSYLQFLSLTFHIRFITKF